VLLIFVAKLRMDKIIYHQLHKLKCASLLVFAMCSSCFVMFNGLFLILFFVIFVMLFMVFASGGVHHGFFIIFFERVGGGVQCVLLNLMYLFLVVFMVFNVVLLVFFHVFSVMFIMVFLVYLIIIFCSSLFVDRFH
jgi:hypothetical protein